MSCIGSTSKYLHLSPYDIYKGGKNNHEHFYIFDYMYTREIHFTVKIIKKKYYTNLNKNVIFIHLLSNTDRRQQV
jgi:hypothetical protein